MKEYQTIRSLCKHSFIEKKSEFIAYIAPVNTEIEAENFIVEIRKKNKNATHNVPAYFIREGEKARCSDDGEPQGTAGVPILEVIKKNQLVDVAVVVTRYFGGIMLGAGGLVRAYSKATSLVIQEVEKVRYVECHILNLKMNYHYYGILMNRLSKIKHKLLEDFFGAEVCLKILILSNQTENFVKELNEISSGTIKVENEGITFAEIV